jgi:hypothetical protein
MPKQVLDPEGKSPGGVAITSPEEMYEYSNELMEVQGMRRTICIDFDGVIHSYASGWKSIDDIPDPPVEGAIEFLRRLITAELLTPAIYSARSKNSTGIQAMQMWLRKYGMSPQEVRAIEWPREKPPATMYIDDRGWRFEGTFPTYNEMLAFDSWINQ